MQATCEHCLERMGIGGDVIIPDWLVYMRLKLDKVGDEAGHQLQDFTRDSFPRCLHSGDFDLLGSEGSAVMAGAPHRVVIGGVQPGINVSPEKFKGASELIYDSIKQSIDAHLQETDIPVPSWLNHETVKRLVTWIDKRVPDNYPLDYQALVRLSSAVWHFKCDPEKFRRLFSSRQDQIKPQELNSEAAGWTFINLVFGWGPDFNTASQELISNFTSATHIIEGVWYFPSHLTRNIKREREKLVSLTFRFIKDSVFEQLRSHPPTFNRFAQKLYERGIDVTLRDEDYTGNSSSQQIANGENQACHCPKTMLDIFDDVLIDRPDPATQIEQFAPKPNDNSSSSGSARRSASASGTVISADVVGSAEMLSARDDLGVNEGSIREFLWTKFSQRKSKRKDRKSVQLWDTPHILQFDTIAQEIRGKIQSHRQQHFRGLHLTQYQQLRRHRLLLPEA